MRENLVERVVREVQHVWDDAPDIDPPPLENAARAAIAVMWDAIKDAGLLSPDLDNLFDAALELADLDEVWTKKTVEPVDDGVDRRSGGKAK